MKYKGSLHIARTKVEQWGKAFSYVDHHRNRRSFSWEKQTLVIIGMCFTSEYGSISLPLVLSKASLDLSQCVSRRFKCYTAMAYELACLVGSEQISMHKESSLQRLMNERKNMIFVYLSNIFNSNFPSLTTVKSVYWYKYWPTLLSSQIPDLPEIQKARINLYYRPVMRTFQLTNFMIEMSNSRIIIQAPVEFKLV